jgi:hypothetical protein
MEQYDYSAEQIVARKTSAKEAEVKKKRKRVKTAIPFASKEMKFQLKDDPQLVYSFSTKKNLPKNTCLYLMQLKRKRAFL